MSRQTLDDMVRRIVREELDALSPKPSAQRPPPLDASPGPLAEVRRFLATAAPRERTQAADLYRMWQRWGESGETALRLTVTGFGRLAMASGLVSREGTTRRFYTPVLARGCVGAPGCPGAMLKGQDRCAEHQEPALG